jgi:hypothetical protein
LKPDGQRREAGHFTTDGLSRRGRPLPRRYQYGSPVSIFCRLPRRARGPQAETPDWTRGDLAAALARLEIFMLTQALREADGDRQKSPNVSPSMSTVLSEGRTHDVANPDSSHGKPSDNSRQINVFRLARSLRSAHQLSTPRGWRGGWRQRIVG